MNKKQVPVIIDTDIGGDMDDTWALLMALKSPEIDVKYISTCTGDTTYRAKIAAKFLEVAGRSDIPVGIGPTTEKCVFPQEDWVKEYDLSQYPGILYSDGVEGFIETVMNAKEPVTIIAIGPFTTIAAAVKREPRIATKSKVVAMAGNIRKVHSGCDTLVPEYNVLADVQGSRDVFNAPWPITITPLDTCGIVKLVGTNYSCLKSSTDPTVIALLENYRAWSKSGGNDWVDHGSTILFDTVAVYLAFTEYNMVMEDLPLVIEDDGFTAIDPAGRMVRCANEWTDLEAYHTFLSKRILSNSIVPAPKRTGVKQQA